MARQRSIIAGTTDYTGVTLPEIVVDCQDWLENTVDSINQLTECRAEVEAGGPRFIYAPAVTNYIEFFVDLFSRYQSDFQRLVNELPTGVTKAHLETLRQLVESAKLEEHRCVRFKEEEIARSLPDESVRPLLDRIYSVTRGTLLDYYDLSNLHRRLRALRKAAVPADSDSSDLDALELKPNIFGLGLNFNHIIRRLRAWWRSRKREPEA